MDPRERFLAAIHRGLADCVPGYAAFAPRLLETLHEKTGGGDPVECFGYEMREDDTS